MILSILIPSLENRSQQLSNLVCSLISQCGSITGIKNYRINKCSIVDLKFKEVEIIIAIDNKSITTGEKRNLLIDCSTGEYIITIDDDDNVPSYYVEELLKASKSNADCFAINGKITTDGIDEVEWRLSKDNPNVTIFEEGKKVYLRTTNHITATKRSLAILAGFPSKSLAEDKEYSIRLNPHLKTEYKINKPMYHYRFSSHNKEY
jgi:hypothetical protein